jgi:O-antigen/teichoic acid export membrane protein
VRGRLRRNSLYSLLGFAVPSLLFLLFTPMLLHGLGTAGYGLWSIALAAFGLLGVLEFGLGTAIAKYVAEYRSADDVGGLSSTVTLGFLVYLAVAIVLTVPLLVVAGSVARLFDSEALDPSQVTTVIRLVALGLLPLLVLSGALAIAVGFERFEIPMAAAIAQNGLTILVAGVVVALDGSVTAVVVSSLCVLWLVAATAVVVGLRLLRGAGAGVGLRRGYARTTLRYVLFTGISGLGTLAFSSLDRLAVGAVLGLRAATYYTISIGVASKLLSLADVLTRPLMPAASGLERGGDTAGVLHYLRRGTAAVAAVSLGLGVLLVVVSEPLLRIWLGTSFAEHALWTFRILVVVYALIALAAPGYHVANGIGYAWVCALGAVLGGAATIGLIFLLGSAFGLVGTAWANAAYCANLAIPIYVAHVLSARMRPGGRQNVGVREATP